MYKNCLFSNLNNNLMTCTDKIQKKIEYSWQEEKELFCLECFKFIKTAIINNFKYYAVILSLLNLENVK
jgi:hypothetical protein